MPPRHSSAPTRGQTAGRVSAPGQGSRLPLASHGIPEGPIRLRSEVSLEADSAGQTSQGPPAAPMGKQGKGHAGTDTRSDDVGRAGDIHGHLPLTWRLDNRRRPIEGQRHGIPDGPARLRSEVALEADSAGQVSPGPQAASMGRQGRRHAGARSGDGGRAEDIRPHPPGTCLSWNPVTRWAALAWSL